MRTKFDCVLKGRSHPGRAKQDGSAAAHRAGSASAVAVSRREPRDAQLSRSSSLPMPIGRARASVGVVRRVSEQRAQQEEPEVTFITRIQFIHTGSSTWKNYFLSHCFQTFSAKSLDSRQFELLIANLKAKCNCVLKLTLLCSFSGRT